MQIRLNKEFFKKNFFNLILGAVLLSALIVFSFISFPLIKKIRQERRQYRYIANEVMESELRIEKVQRLDKQKLKREYRVLLDKLPLKLNLPIVLDELAKVGRYYNIDFISISPEVSGYPEAGISHPQEDASRTYESLPIRLNIKAGYVNLGNYLEALENLKHALVTVKQMHIKKAEEASSNLDAELEIEVYNLADGRFQG